MSDKRAGRATALFDDAAFAEDLNRASDTGREVALAARKAYEQDGVPVEHLLACDEEGPDGTALANCMKVYLPRPAGKFGMSWVSSYARASRYSFTPPSAYVTILATPTPLPFTR